MRKALKALGLLLTLALLALAVFIVNLVWFRPFSLDLFYEKAFVEVALDSPELLTSIGIAEQFGWRRHNSQLDDLSETQQDREFARWKRGREQLAAYELDQQTPEQRLSTQILAWFIDDQLAGERFRHHNYPLNQLWGVQNQLPDFLIQQHRIDDQRGAEDYLARLAQVGRKFDQALDSLKLRESKGIVPPRFVIERVLTEMQGFAATPAAQNPLALHLAERLQALKDLAPAEREALQQRGVQLIETVVRPAYARLIEFMEGQRSRAGTDDGAWKLPDGAAYYAWRLRSQTTSNMTPEQVHTLGLSEVARIEGEMRTILLAENELPEGERPALALARLTRDPRFLYPDTAAGREAIITDYKRMLEEQLERSRTLFGRLPKGPIEVRRVPEFREKTAPQAYYSGPALDGTRPGVFYINLRDVAELPRFGMRTLAIHEGIPGHHFQISIAQEQSGGPTFRKLLPFTAYHEGWALYAEWLAVEMRFYVGNPYNDLGRLSDEMLRAVRLVVDTGIHHKRWTREQAIAYMVEKTGMPEAAVVTEIERYIVDPGQACAYKIGMLAIRAARERAAEALGPRFDAEALKAFHDRVLSGGAMPLQVLDEQLDAWIAERRR